MNYNIIYFFDNKAYVNTNNNDYFINYTCKEKYKFIYICDTIVVNLIYNYSNDAL